MNKRHALIRCVRPRARRGEERAALKAFDTVEEPGAGLARSLVPRPTGRLTHVASARAACGGAGGVRGLERRRSAAASRLLRLWRAPLLPRDARRGAGGAPPQGKKTNKPPRGPPRGGGGRTPAKAPPNT